MLGIQEEIMIKYWISRSIKIAYGAILGGLSLMLSLGVPDGVRAQDTKAIHIATEGTFPPWSFSDPDGTLRGFSIDLTEDLCKRLAYKCEISGEEFSALIPGLTVGKFDAVISALSVTKERSEIVDFTRPFARLSNRFMVSKDSDLSELPGTGGKFDLDKQADAAQAAITEMNPLLKGKLLGVQAASISSKFVDKYLSNLVEIREYKNIADHDIDLVAGRIDLVMGSEVVLNKSLQSKDLQGFKLAGPAFVGGVFGLGYGVAVKKGRTQLRDAFDQALAQAISDGTIKRLSHKWLGIDVTP